MYELSARAFRGDMMDAMAADRDFFHAHPELGFDLQEGCAYIRRQLEHEGYAPREICPCALVATVGSGRGKTILLRADYDALPVDEPAGHPARSQNPGAAHTCGHDAHAAMLLGAARLLKRVEDQIEGTVKLVFQPNEEGVDKSCPGAKAIVDAGVLEDPPVDAALALHALAPYPLGAVCAHPGRVLTSTDSFHITVTGLGGHGAMPHNCVDPIAVAVRLYQALEELVARETPPSATAVLTVSGIRAGGPGGIIPSSCEMWGALRAYDPDLRTHLLRRMEELCWKLPPLYRATASIEQQLKLGSIHTDSALLAELAPFVREIVRPEKTDLAAGPVMPSEDFSFLSNRVPTAHLYLGFGEPGDGGADGAEKSALFLRDRALPTGAALYANCALEWLRKNRLPG
ncbi:amidohydrolase [Bittarella massiliensis]|uniref:M20 metallopeptidase family protein n=1 Tax=Bittarella massiliensis (ex Durand et al. 2017) TaxID=1720313 RepID=UPI00163BF0FE|nr:M20 family metallopeptidase [Bittarella massiliensis (ex Durand et al. 2017)]MBC2872156.1 amidohydrolase [Bittarella massiliensis (ex Durand et al. 2017)]